MSTAVDDSQRRQAGSSTMDAARARRAWYIGGALLVVAGAVGVAVQQTSQIADPTGVTQPVMQISGMLLFAAGVLVLTWSRVGSVVARRPVGLTTLTVFALTPPVMLVAALVPGGGAWLIWLEGVLLLSGAVSAFEIGRIGAVPAWWRWLPACWWIVTAGLVIAVTIAPEGLPALTGLTPSPLVRIAVWGRVTPFASLILGAVVIALALDARRRGARVHGSPSARRMPDV